MTDHSTANSKDDSIRVADDTASHCPDSYHALLEAAVSEFATRGFDGARIEAIARAADYNKSLIYRHFKTKEGLFDAALKFKLDERIGQLKNAPEPTAEAMLYWLKITLKNRDFTRILMGESLHNDGEPVVDEAWRHEYYQQHVDRIREYQEQGRFPAHLDPRLLMVVLTSIVFFPAVMPQMVRLITGISPDSLEFLELWKETVDALSNGFQRLADDEKQT